MQVKQFLHNLKKHENASSVLTDFESRSKQGFVYERLWDLCIKFGLVKELTLNDKVLHYFDNTNYETSAAFKITEKLDEYLVENVLSGNSSGYSDISFRTNDNNDHTEVRVSIKYYATETYVDEYDIQKLCTQIDQQKDKIFKVFLFVKDKEKFIKVANKANRSSNLLIKYISPRGQFENVYDLIDLEKYYKELKALLEYYNYLQEAKDIKEFKKYLGFTKKLFQPRFHQELFINKISDCLAQNQDKILVGAVPRSGKTYIIAGTILEYVKRHKEGPFKKFIIITPAPTETIPQYIDAIEQYLDFDIYNVKCEKISKRNIDDYNFNKPIKQHTVYIISKQKLGYPEKKKQDIHPLLNEIVDNATMAKVRQNIKTYFGDTPYFDLIFLDEAHFGMSTEQAKIIIGLLNEHSTTPKIYVTATYNKPNQIYNIPNKNKILWDLSDIAMMKKLSQKYSLSHFAQLYLRFVEIFGKSVLRKTLKSYNWNFKEKYENRDNVLVVKQIASQYKHFPSPFLLTTVWYDYEQSYKNMYNEVSLADGTNVSFDMEKLFTVKGDTFVNSEQVQEVLHYYFGYPRKTIENEKVPYKYQLQYKKYGVMPRIQGVCDNTCRTLQYPNHVTSQLWFLPYGPGRKIEDIIRALLVLLQTKFHNVFKNYIFVVCTDQNDSIKGLATLPEYDNVVLLSGSDIKKNISYAEKRALKDHKEGVIILTAAKLQLGISLQNVDIVALFNNISSSDAIYQMMFRSMTEVDNNTECDGSTYCPNKKYGFIVDMNPQRTILYLNYITNELSAKTNDKKANFRLITELFNIDRDFFTNKYDSQKDIAKYSDELMQKLSKDYSSKTESYKSIISEFIFDLDRTTVQNLRHMLVKIKKSKEKIIDEGIDHQSNRIEYERGISQSADREEIIQDNQVDEVSYDFTNDIRNLLSEVIFLTSLLSANYGIDNINRCIFDKKHDFQNFKFEMQTLLDRIEHDDILSDIFVNTINERVFACNQDAPEMFGIIKNIIQSIKHKQEQSGGNQLMDTINDLVYTTKNKIYNIEDPDKLLDYIHENLAPKSVEKKERGEVFTSPSIINEMLDQLPKHVWSNPHLKWLDPAAGMGNFPVMVYMRLIKSLRSHKMFSGKSEHFVRKHILENMLYMVEINKKNVFLMEKILCGRNKYNPSNKYNLNIYTGSFIDTDEKAVDILGKTSVAEKNKEFEAKLEAFGGKFDIIMGNPPYQYQKPGNTNSQAIWHIFVLKSAQLINENGYLVYIHPSGWRDIDGDYRKVFDYIHHNSLIYLSMNDYKTGNNVFGVGTNFDYYILQNKLSKNNITKVKDIDGNIIYIDLNKYNFIPSGKFDTFNKLIAKEQDASVQIVRDSTYHTQKKYVAKTKNGEFKYPCCYSITQKDGMKFYYSNEKKGHFGVSKLIWSNGAGTYPILDENGEYGLTEFCYAIIDNKSNLKRIQKAMNSKEFIDLMKYLKFKKDEKYNYRIIRLFKKDFYKHF